jgi:hypothetical protein
MQGQDCLSIKEILIPEFVDVCTSDLPVFYEDNTKQRKIIFLTILGTLRNDTEEIDCLNTPDEFQINEYTIERTKKKYCKKDFCYSCNKISYYHISTKFKDGFRKFKN